MGLGHLLVYKSKNFGSWVYQLMIQFIVLSSFFLQDYISFIFLLVFFFVVFSFGVVVFLHFLRSILFYRSFCLSSFQSLLLSFFVFSFLPSNGYIFITELLFQNYFHFLWFFNVF